MRQSAREMAQTPQKLKLRWRCATRSILIRRQTQIHRSFNHSHLIYSFRTKIQWGMFLGVVRNSRGIQLQEGNMWPEGPEQTSVLQSHMSSILSLIVKKAGKYLNLLIDRLWNGDEKVRESVVVFPPALSRTGKQEQEIEHRICVTLCYSKK